MNKPAIKCDIDETTCRHVAEILGPSSSAAAAIKELDRRREDGVPASLIRNGSIWLVVSPVKPA